ncbi:MAG TPA: alternative ribosome rescue aminoacyl-tRNA hydrolase ArfB [Pseudonocardiaceae bacterium]|nr:alternative ribosome rescue aminoacyl-tRNA hydrolase ArfB [Pseudonocardiaceae bacterium]
MSDGVRVVGSEVVVPEGELGWRFSRASGPGGQGVNTTDSRVELVFDVTASTAFTEYQRVRVLERLSGHLVAGVLTVVAAEYRSQLRNREAARARLATLLGQALAPDPPARRPTRPSRAARERRIADKRRRTLTKRLRRQTED